VKTGELAAERCMRIFFISYANIIKRKKNQGLTDKLLILFSHNDYNQASKENFPIWQI